MKKFKVSTLACVVTAVIDLALIVLYIICLNLLESSDGSLRSFIDIVTNILIVGISILSTSLITIPFVQIKSDNTLCEQILFGDVLASPKLFDCLPLEKKLQVLHDMESNIYFNSCVEKESMYCSIRNKINDSRSDDFDGDLFFETCEYDVECRLKDDHIIKTITKSVEIKAFQKSHSVNSYTLCTSAYTNAAESVPYLTMESLHINGSECDVEHDITEKEMSNSNPLNVKSGYKKFVGWDYNKRLQFSPTESTKIVITYTTDVADSDTAYSCRLSYPCKKFKFKYKLIDEQLANKYNINLNAFGFYDDGHKSPNTHRKSEVKVEFDYWMFPSDGVSVSLINKQAQDTEHHLAAISSGSH